VCARARTLLEDASINKACTSNTIMVIDTAPPPPSAPPPMPRDPCTHNVEQCRCRWLACLPLSRSLLTRRQHAAGAHSQTGTRRAPPAAASCPVVVRPARGSSRRADADDLRSQCRGPSGPRYYHRHRPADASCPMRPRLRSRSRCSARSRAARALPFQWPRRCSL